MEWDFLKIAANLAAYSFQAVLMVFLLVAYQGNQIDAVKNNLRLFCFTESKLLNRCMPCCDWHRSIFDNYPVKQKLLRCTWMDFKSDQVFS